MPRKGKEPAGLRRWRLAHRRKHRVRRLKVVHHMARRRRFGRKGKGRRGSRAFPIMGALPVIVPAYVAYTSVGLTKAFPKNYLYQQTGYTIDSNIVDTAQVAKVLGLAVLGFAGHKIANKIGVNKYVKRATAGMLQL